MFGGMRNSLVRGVRKKSVWRNDWDGSWCGVLRDRLFRDVEGIHCLGEADCLRVCGRSFQMDSFVHATYPRDSKLWLGWNRVGSLGILINSGLGRGKISRWEALSWA